MGRTYYAVVEACEDKAGHPVPKDLEARQTASRALSAASQNVRMEQTAHDKLYATESEAMDAATKAARVTPGLYAIVKVQIGCHVDHLATVASRVVAERRGGSGPVEVGGAP